MTLFSKKGDPSDKPPGGDISTPALKMIVEGRERNVSFAELTLSNNLAQQALTRLLMNKGIITAEELLEAMSEVRKENYPDADSGKADG